MVSTIPIQYKYGFKYSNTILLIDKQLDDFKKLFLFNNKNNKE